MGGDDRLVNLNPPPKSGGGQASLAKSQGVDLYSESGKTEFGFWLITDAGKSKTVTVQYRVPLALSLSKGSASYEFYIQKQPALKIKNFNFTLQKPEGLVPEASSPLLTQSASSADGKDSAYSYTAPLENDLMVKVNFK